MPDVPSPVLGLHHVTVIAGAAQAHLDFYAGTLGLRLVKRTVNFDDPSTHHLYFADDQAHPGSFYTSFPWADARPGRHGAGQVAETAWAAPEGAVDYWTERLAERVYDDWDAPVERFGRKTLALRDPHGLALAVVEEPGATGGWADGPVPAEAALGAFDAVTLALADPEPTARLLTEAMGYREASAEGGRLRLENPRADRAAFVDLVVADERGRMGAGVVHHVAFRVATDEDEAALRETILARGLQPTEVIDRQYFHSVYFREPGGVLFEIATDPPGFAIDEPAGRLGRALMLPPQYEGRRAQIEAALPPLRLPYGDVV